MNRTVLVSDPKWFGIQEINPYESAKVQPNREALMAEHEAVVAALRQHGFTVQQIRSPDDCLDGVYTANWALVRGRQALLANLPPQRSGELLTATVALLSNSIEARTAPYAFSGQGDVLRIRDNLYVMGHGYRTDVRMVPIVQKFLDAELIVLKAKPKRTWYGRPVVNKLTKMPDSYAYDIDLAVGVIDENTIVACLKALTRTSRKVLSLACAKHGITIIEVPLKEARGAYACNLVSDGRTVVMAEGAPLTARLIRMRDKRVIELPNSELRKGGGGFRCITLTLSHTEARS